MSKIHDKIKRFLGNARRVIDNARNIPEVRQALEEYGYNNLRFEEGESLLQNAENLVNEQIEKFGPEFGLTPELIEAWEEAEQIYTLYRRLARIAMRRYTGKEAPILINQKKKFSLSGWLYQTEVFYTNALNKDYIRDALKRFDLNQERLKAGQNLVRKVHDLNLIQEREKREEKARTIEVDIALDKLDDWILEMIDVARSIFDEQPELFKLLEHKLTF